MRPIVFKFLFFAMAAFWLASTPAYADRSSIALHGFVMDRDEEEPLDTTTIVTFNVYADCDEGSPLWTSRQTVEFINGFYSVSLEIPDDVMDAGENLCVGIQIADDEELSPRVEMYASPYAMTATTADTAASADVATVALSLDSTNLPNLAGSGLTVSGGALSLDTSSSQTWTGTQTYNAQIVATKVPADTSSSSATMLINPVFTNNGENKRLLVVQANGSDEFIVDKEGDVTINGDLTVTGSVNISGLGDITAVNVGSGLTGGGTSGDVTVSIATGGVTSTLIADSTIVSADINDDTITAADLNATLTFGAADLVDFSASINDGKGLRLPQGASNPANTADIEGLIFWDSDDEQLRVYDADDDIWVSVGNTLGNSIDSSEITDGTITAADLGTDSVAADEIAADAVGSSEIAADAVGSGEIAADAVGTSEIATDGVGAAEIATGAVATTEILDNTITATDITATLTFADADFIDLGAVLHDDAAEQGLRLPNVGVSPTDPTSTNEGYIAYDETNNLILVNTGAAWVGLGLFGSAIDSSEITDGTITADDLAADSVAASEIAADAVGSSEIAAGAVGTSEIADGVVTGTDIDESTLVLTGLVDDDDLATGAVDGGSGGEIADNSIDVNDLATTLTFADGDFIDLSAINNSGTSEGLKLPQAADCSSATAEGQICWDTDGDVLYIGDGAAAVSIGNPFGASIDSADITNDAVTGTDIDESTLVLTGLIDDDDLAAGAVDGGTGGEIADGSITAADLGTDSVATDEIAAGAVGTSELADGVIAAADLDVSMAPTWTGAHTFTQTVTATGSIQDVNVTLGNDADVDTVSGVNIDVTSAATGDADIVYGLNVGNLSSADATVLERAIRIGSGWDQALDVNGTLISEAELQALDNGIESADIAADTIVAADIAADAVGTSEIATDGVGAAEIAADAVGQSELAESMNFVPTGAWDFGGATSMEIPNGAAPTVDAAGEIALDTTGDQIKYYGGAERVLTYKQFKSVTIESPADADNFMMFKAPYGLTITDIECVVDPADTGESVVIDVQERNSDGDSEATVDTTITCANTNTSDDGTLTNGAIDANDWVSIDIGTVTGTVTQVSVTVTYTVDAT